MRERVKHTMVTIDQIAEQEIAKAHEMGYPEPDFDFRKLYKKGDKIYYLHVISDMGVKEILALTVQSVFARCITAFEPKSTCSLIPYRQRNMIFTNRAEALEQYEKTDVQEVN